MMEANEGNEGLTIDEAPYTEEVQRIPTPINQLPNYHDKENNGQRLEAIKDYLKKDNQFESVPEEIEAENREESDLENSIRSSPMQPDRRRSNECTEKSQDEEEELQFNDKDQMDRELPTVGIDGSQSQDHVISTLPDMKEEEDLNFNNVSLEVLTSRIKQRNQELLENSQISSNMKVELDRSYSSCNSHLRKQEVIKKPSPLKFDDDNCEDINPIVSF